MCGAGYVAAIQQGNHDALRRKQEWGGESGIAGTQTQGAAKSLFSCSSLDRHCVHLRVDLYQRMYLTHDGSKDGNVLWSLGGVRSLLCNVYVCNV